MCFEFLMFNKFLMFQLIVPVLPTCVICPALKKKKIDILTPTEESIKGGLEKHEAS